MKIGIVSDIHGNTAALEAILQEFKMRNIEKIICCGDTIGIGPNPEESVQKLIEIKDNLISVRGNHEGYLLDGIPEIVHDDKIKVSDRQRANHKWIHSQISEESREFLNNLPKYKEIEIENKKICIVHYPMYENETFKKFIQKADIDECEELFSDIDADIFLYGHTHKENVQKRNGKWYINPGSLGCLAPTRFASAGILTINQDKVDYEQLNIEYDFESVIEDIKNSNMPFCDGVLRHFFGIIKKLEI